jgi:hypothetical protein
MVVFALFAFLPKIKTLAVSATLNLALAALLVYPFTTSPQSDERTILLAFESAFLLMGVGTLALAVSLALIVRYTVWAKSQYASAVAVEAVVASLASLDHWEVLPTSDYRRQEAMIKLEALAVVIERILPR